MVKIKPLASRTRDRTDEPTLLSPSADSTKPGPASSPGVQHAGSAIAAQPLGPRLVEIFHGGWKPKEYLD
jgi:hypothetical protein